MKSLILCALMVSTTVACARSNSDSKEQSAMTKQFLAKYNGTFVDPSFNEAYKIGADGSLQMLRVPQVGGGENSKVPYPTVCGYIRLGKIESVVERSAEDRARYIGYSTHEMEMSFDRIILTNRLDRAGDVSTLSNPNCETFLAEERGFGEVHYTEYLELVADGSGFRTNSSGGGDYKQGGPRTPSTLDENFKKVTGN